MKTKFYLLVLCAAATVLSSCGLSKDEKKIQVYSPFYYSVNEDYDAILSLEDNGKFTEFIIGSGTLQDPDEYCEIQGTWKVYNPKMVRPLLVLDYDIDSYECFENSYYDAFLDYYQRECEDYDLHKKQGEEYGFGPYSVHDGNLVDFKGNVIMYSLAAEYMDEE